MADIHSVDFSRIHHFVIDRNVINRWLEIFKDYFILAVYFIALIVSFLYYAVQVLFCASIGMVFAKIFGLELETRVLIRLSVIAFTPPIVLQTAHSLLDIEFPYGSVISFLLATCYLYFAVGACSEKKVSKLA